MEIKKGYKMTDVGVIPEDWEVKSIGEVLSICNGMDYKHLNRGNYPVYGTGGLIARVDDYLFEGESVCIGRKGTIDTPIYLNEKFWTVDTLFYSINFVGVIPKFIYYIFNTIDWLSLNEASGVPSLSKDNIKLQLIQIPNLSEQQAIADALTKADNLITSLSKVIEKKKMIKKGAMQKLLSGEMRLDGFEGEFATKTFSDFIERFATGLNPRDNFELNKGGNNYYVTIKNFINGKLFLDDNCDKITDEAIDIIDKRSSLKVGDVLFSSIGRIGDAYVINENPTNWNINESVFALRPNPTIMDSFFLYYLIKSDSVQKKFDDAISGSTLKSIKLNDLKEIECTYPQNIDEQTAIANILTTMDNEIEALEKERDKYKCIKQGMMLQLLTGKIRLTCQ